MDRFQGVNAVRKLFSRLNYSRAPPERPDTLKMSYSRHLEGFWGGFYYADYPFRSLNPLSFQHYF